MNTKENLSSPVQGEGKPAAPRLTNAEVIEALDFAKQLLREHATISGYGFYRPRNPHDFYPDQDSCSAEEIANHKAACDAWDRGEYKRDDWDGWLYNESGKPAMHILRAPWGIGSYSETDEDMEARALVLHRMSEEVRRDASAIGQASNPEAAE